ncbi:MAG: cadherin repeat domain-containing protein, partial [Ekhidna sp.]|nr:cadherin repeat domain-containing protein [Ekhidna sp.]
QFFLGIVLFNAFGLALISCGDDDEKEPANSAPTIANQTFSIAEDAANGTAVGTVKATDAEKDKLTFSIAAGNTGDVFAIAEGTGAITVAGALDFETTPTYTLKVSVSDGKLSGNADITVNVTDAPDPGDRDPDKDINGLRAAGNTSLYGLWSDGTTMWVCDSDDKKLYAYTLATGIRDESKDIALMSDAQLEAPQGIWSDGTTMWVGEDGDAKIYAYVLATGTRDESKEVFDLTTGGGSNPQEIWSDGTTMWVLYLRDPKLYAYTLATVARDESKDINRLGTANTTASGLWAFGLWSDGTTMWVASDGDYDDEADQLISDPKIYAYVLATGARDKSKEVFDLVAAGNTNVGSLWSDGTTMWVCDWGDYDDDTDQWVREPKIFAYRMPQP